MCMVFYKRDTYITEIQMGLPVLRLEDACTLENFDTNSLPFVTLLGKLNIGYLFLLIIKKCM